MNEENTKRLYHEFPRLYRERENDSLMRWGFSCSDGWFRLVYDLSAAIESRARELGLDPESDEWPKVVQVKEKFGSLSFYTRAVHQSILDLIVEAQSRSGHICEQCGLPGEWRTKTGWYHTSCDRCENKIKAGEGR